MSYAQDNGYTGQTFAEIMTELREGVNAQFGTSYTDENFTGTNWYKYSYVWAQKVLLGETKTSEIFTKLQEYIATTNLRIQRPSVSVPGLLDSFDAEGYVVSVKKNLIGDAGTISICVLVDADDPDYAAIKLEICTLIKSYVVAGMVTLGDQVESITLTNGQSFDFKFYLPDPTPVILRVTITRSDNTILPTPTDETIRAAILANIGTRYRLGWNFEPQRYYTLDDAPWASSVLFEWSINDGADWETEIFDAGFRDLFTLNLEDIELVIDP